MSLIVDSALEAIRLMASGDARLMEVAQLSVRVSGTATIIAALIALPLAAWLVQTRSAVRAPVVVMLNACMALPPVIVGLVVYLLLSRSGPLGALGWLFTPNGMIVAQTVLITPIIAALARQTLDDAQLEYRDLFGSLGLSRWQSVATLLYETRFSLLIVLLAGFGRAIAEVGAVMMVGGNIAGETRVMTTAIALETSKGELASALALGMVLLLIVLVVNALAQSAKTWIGRRYV
ncbi:MAG: ABC transporter permease subunit [Betaproteobacteria bacterium]|nr:MAG: ABC transporter permease subunit [Betaproteobacteria bacterium]TAG49738.1 MAG: ABC transporter permease subunit [Betaproteobacteria bacterium]